MDERSFNNKEILEAVEIILQKNSKEEKIEAKEPSLPKDTERIITQAENFLKNKFKFSKSFILTKLFERDLLLFFISS